MRHRLSLEYFRMHSIAHRLPFSPVKLCVAIAALLLVVYIALIATVMSYAALTVEFAQQAKNEEAAVAILEAKYLATVAEITRTDFAEAGYAKPVAKTFVPTQSVTALR